MATPNNFVFLSGLIVGATGSTGATGVTGPTGATGPAGLAAAVDGIRLTPQSSAPYPGSPTQGVLWVRDDGALMYTDLSNADYEVSLSS